MLELVKVKLATAAVATEFVAKDIGLRIGDRCIVATERGNELGTVIAWREGMEAPSGRKSKVAKVVRKATERDLHVYERRRDKEDLAFRLCRKKIRSRKLPMELSLVEYVYDGSRVVFYFTANRRVDFRDLVKDLARDLRVRIEMRQIGARDEAKLIGGFGCCGLTENCCSSFLSEMRSVSVKAAKALDLALNPNRLSGLCGRLKCCLNFETGADRNRSEDRQCEQNRGGDDDSLLTQLEI